MWWWFWDPLAGNGIQGSGHGRCGGLISLRRQGLPGRVLGSGSSGTVLPLDPGPGGWLPVAGAARGSHPPISAAVAGGLGAEPPGSWGSGAKPQHKRGGGAKPQAYRSIGWSGRGTGRRAGSAAGQRWAQPAPGQFDHGDQGFGSVEPVGDPGQQTYVGVGRLAPGVTQTCLLYTSPSPRDGLLSR